VRRRSVVGVIVRAVIVRAVIVRAVIVRTVIVRTVIVRTVIVRNIRHDEREQQSRAGVGVHNPRRRHRQQQGTTAPHRAERHTARTGHPRGRCSTRGNASLSSRMR